MNETLGRIFESVSSKFNRNTAIISESQSYSYSMLRQSALILANFLLNSLNLKSGAVVGIINTKEYSSCALMLGCLYAGICYVNIDVNAPNERIHSIIQQCNLKFVFIDSESGRNKSTSLGNSFTLLGISEILDISPKDVDLDRVFSDIYVFDEDTAAYIMFTSGSTGNPKGVVVSHANLKSFIGWSVDRFSLDGSDNFAQLSPMYFDNSVFDFYSALFSGSALTLVSRELLSSPHELIRFLELKKCTIWFSVPSLLIYMMRMHALDRSNLKYFRLIIFGGEGFPKSELNTLWQLREAHTELVNVYGPTECTCIATSYSVCEDDFSSEFELVPLGKVNCNIDYYVRDRGGSKGPGELVLLGPNVALGYIGSSQSSDSFFIETGIARFGKRGYRTGDLVSTDSYGRLIFHGRQDNQIKHMGYRIELEEIELAINKIKGVSRAVVTYQKRDMGFGRICAYCQIDTDISELEISSQLINLLPSYMQPSVIYTVDFLPTNANGKVDRNQLKQID